MLPGTGSLVSKSATGRSDGTRTTAIPEVGSLPTNWAGVRVPSDSSNEMARAPATAAAVVAMMPPDSAVTPVATDTPEGRVTVRATNDGRTAATMWAISVPLDSCAVPGSVVGGVDNATRLDVVVARDGPPPSGEAPEVAITRPEASRAPATQAAAPPTIHGLGRLRSESAPPNRASEACLDDIDSEGCLHRRSSGEIQPRMGSGVPSPWSGPSEPKSVPSGVSPLTDMRLATRSGIGRSPTLGEGPARSTHPLVEQLALRWPSGS